MKTVYDAAKNARNIEQRGLSFEDVVLMNWDNTLIVEDTRKDYGETRYRAFGYIYGKPHSAAYTMRGDVMRIITFRRAEEKGEETI